LISGAAFAQVSVRDAQNPADNPVKDSANPGQAPLDQLNLANPQGKTIIPPPEKPDKALQFFTDSKVAAQLRSYYFYRDKFDDSLSEAFALGGSLSWKSGYFMDVFAVGAVIALEALFAGPITGASMNPARSFARKLKRHRAP